MRALILLLVIVGVVGCDGAIEVCHFASGRPCPSDRACLGPQGDECNYYACRPEEGVILGTAIACQAGVTEPVAGGPFNCDPATIAVDRGLLTPPPAPCPLGSLWSIHLPPDTGGVYGHWGRCVPVAQCRPIPCDPAFAGDGCPSDHVCAAATRTCVAP